MSVTVKSTTDVAGVRITPADHGAKTIGGHKYVASCHDLIQQVTINENLQQWQERVMRNKQKKYEGKRYTEEGPKRPQDVEIFHSTFHNRNRNSNGNGKTDGKDEDTTALMMSENGLVWSAIYAYSGHHHLTLRAEDIWFAILTQFSAYLNAHAKEFRHLFVAHKGKKELMITQYANRHTADYSSLTNSMGDMIQENIIDVEFRAWLMPNFSTTTADDTVLAGVLMMATMQEYFSYTFRLCCGLPSVTLLGRREDYEQILSKLNRLERYGDEPTQFAKLLRPIISRFIRSFDDPKAPEVREFWQKIAHVEWRKRPDHI